MRLYGQECWSGWDALWTMRDLYKQLKGTHRHSDVVRPADMLVRCFLENYRKTDGAFAFARAFCLPAHHSIRISDPLPISDMLGTYMSLQCLAHADEWNR